MATMTKRHPTQEHEEDRLALQFWVLSEALRLRILHSLNGSPMTVGELVRQLRAPQSTVSRHLGRLKDAEFVHQDPRNGSYCADLQMVERVLGDAAHFLSS